MHEREGGALRPLQPTLSLRMLSTASPLLALVEDQKAFGNWMIHVMLMVREVSLLHKRDPQLALVREGHGAGSNKQQHGGLWQKKCGGGSEGRAISPGEMLCLVPVGDRPAKAMSPDPRLLLSHNH